MSFQSWLQDLGSVVTPSGAKPYRKRRGSLDAAKHRLHFESLEDRRLLAFLAPMDYAVGLEPSEVASGDFNNDGRPDLATTNYGDGTVSLLLGNADGTFQPALSSAAGPFPLSLAAGHFNADQNLDLAVTTYDPYGDNDVSILLGNGAGTFVSAASLSIPWWFVPVSVSTGDMNNDGLTDLVVAADDVEYGHGGSVNVILGQGNGNFEPAVAYGAYTGQYNSRALALADFNSDGNTDVVVAGSRRTVKVLLGNGNGTLGTARDFGADYAARSIAVGDFNADGKLDLAVTDGHDYGSPGVADVNILLGTGTGTFPTAQSFAAGTGPVAIAAGDVNADGKLDLVVTNVDGLSVLLGTGGGSFGSPIASANRFGGNVVLADFNGDHRPDAVTSNSQSNRVSVMINDGNWTSLPPTPPAVSISDFSKAEGMKGKTTVFTFTVTLSAAYDQPVMMSYRTMNGTATTSNSDYVAKTGTLTFAPGETTKTITIEVKGDSKKESEETFYLDLFGLSSNALFTKNRGIGTILNDD